MKNKMIAWLAFVVTSVLLSGYYAYALNGEDNAVYLPGQSSDGHYQIELACDACHGDAFDDQEIMQRACVKCHGSELKQVDDSHPKSKFTDPRNADRVAILDARYCVTCHVEHRPQRTGPMGVSMPRDVCFLCHQKVGDNRKSHRDLRFDSCASAGCHNYHDNKALYEDFLVKHMNEDRVRADAALPQKNYAEHYRTTVKPKKSPLRREDVNAPARLTTDARIVKQWERSGHARSGINCDGCHRQSRQWQSKPGRSTCAKCHQLEEQGFLAGRHGMRLAQQLSSMTPATARAVMKQDAGDKTLDCHSCHADHRYDVRRAAVDACLSCHDDQHSRAYKQSAHFQLLPKTGGVSCAGCHMPRETRRDKTARRIVVQHNQNHNLRPNEKMIRSVCMHCHGLGFSIDALADAALVENNFQGQPKKHIESIDMAKQRELQKRNASSDS